MVRPLLNVTVEFDEETGRWEHDPNTMYSTYTGPVSFGIQGPVPNFEDPDSPYFLTLPLELNLVIPDSVYQPIPPPRPPSPAPSSSSMGSCPSVLQPLPVPGPNPPGPGVDPTEGSSAPNPPAPAPNPLIRPPALDRAPNRGRPRFRLTARKSVPIPRRTRGFLLRGPWDDISVSSSESSSRDSGGPGEDMDEDPQEEPGPSSAGRRD